MRARQRPPDTISLRISETAFETAVLEAAGWAGWRFHAERASRTSSGRHATAIRGDRGWPDDAMAHPTKGIILAELKTERGSLGPGQREWIDTLAVHDVPGSPVLVEIWRPRDWSNILIALIDGVDDYRMRCRPPR